MNFNIFFVKSDRDTIPLSHIFKYKILYCIASNRKQEYCLETHKRRNKGYLLAVAHIVHAHIYIYVEYNKWLPDTTIDETMNND
jgi:hypothetical protein